MQLENVQIFNIEKIVLSIPDRGPLGICFNEEKIRRTYNSHVKYLYTKESF